MTINTAYKFVSHEMKTRGETVWTLGKTRTAPGGGPLCSDRWIHAYSDPLVAVLMRPIHCEQYTRLWRCDAVVGTDDGTKLGCTEVTLREEIPVPVLTPDQLVRAAIYAAQSLGSHGPVWDAWAGRWLDGTDRSEKAAWAAWAAPEARAEAWAARRAAEAAEWAARAAWRAEARAEARARSAAAAEAVAEAARAEATRAAREALQAHPGLDLAEIVRRAAVDEPSGVAP